MGVFQFVASLLYNLCDSLDIELFLNKTEWHRLTNITGLSYGANVLVYLMCNGSEAKDHLLRYSFFALLWVAQIKDGFWMEHTQYTIAVLLVLALFAAVKIAVGRVWRRYDRTRLRNGVLFAGMAFGFFLASLDDHSDPYRWKHGVAQLLFGAALFSVWQVVDWRAKGALLPGGAQHTL